MVAGYPLHREFRRALIAASLAVDVQAEPHGAATLVVARTKRGVSRQAEALTDLAERLSAPRIAAEAYVAAGRIRDSTTRIRLLARLAPHVPAALLPDLLAQARRSTSPDQRVTLLLALGARLPEAVTEALDTARGRVELVARVVPHLPEPQRRAVADEVLADLEPVADDRVHAYVFADALSAVAPYLADLMPRALAIARRLRAGPRYRVLVALAPHLPPALVPEVLADVRDIDIPQFRAELLTRLGQARCHADETRRALALAALAPYLPAATRLATLTAALPPGMSWINSGLIAHLPATVVRTLATAARQLSNVEERTWALARLVPHLPARDRAATAAEALAGAGNLNDPDRLIEALAPYLPAGSLGDALAHRRHGDGDWSVTVLAALAAHLPEARLVEALAELDELEHGYQRVWALEVLAAHLPDGLPSEALAAARRLAEPQERATAIAALAGRLPARRRSAILAEQVAEATRVASPWVATTMRLALLPHLTGPARTAVSAALLADARAVPDAQRRVDAFAAILPYLTGRHRDRIAEEAWAAAPRLRTLTALLRHVPPADAGAVLDLLDDEPGHRERAHALTALAGHLPAGLLPRAVASAAHLDAWAVDPLRALLTRAHELWRADHAVPLEDLTRQALRGRDRVTCLALVPALAPVLASLEGPGAVHAAADAIGVVGRRWP